MGDERAALVEAVAEAMQHTWDDWCADTGCIPDGFRIAGPPTTRVYADFRHGPFPERVAAAVLDVLGHYEEVGVDFCQVHQGVRNEDESACDMNQGRLDIYDCVFDAVFVKVTGTARREES